MRLYQGIDATTLIIIHAVLTPHSIMYLCSRYHFSMKHIDITMLVIIQQNPTTLGRSLSLDHLNPLMKYAKHINISTSDMIAMNRITSVSVIMVFFTSGFFVPVCC